MDFLFGLFAGVTFWPVAIFLLECVVLLACVNFGNGVVALISVLLTVLIYQFLFGINVIGYAYQNPTTILMWAAIYIATGVLYSLFRWDRHGAKWRRAYDEVNTNYKKSQLWETRPIAKNSKNLIITWMMFWPWSLLWWALSDLVLEVFSTIYRQISKWYDAISNRHMKGVMNPDRGQGDNPDQEYAFDPDQR